MMSTAQDTALTFKKELVAKVFGQDTRWISYRWILFTSTASGRTQAIKW